MIDNLQQRVCLWIDGVGGFAVCNANRFQFGSAFENETANAAVYADIPRNAFAIETSNESTVLYPLCESVGVNGKIVQHACLLHSEDILNVCDSVQLVYRRPHPLSATGLLVLKSRHRWSDHVDAVVLMSHCCVIGNSSSAHIHNPKSQHQWLLTRNKDCWSVARSDPTSSTGGSSTGFSSTWSNPQRLIPMQRFQDDGLQMTLQT